MPMKVVGADIVAARMKKVVEGNIWQYIDKINKQLLTNNIREDGSIDVVANFIVDPEIMSKLEEKYRSVGWGRFDVRYTEPEDGYSGKTIVTMAPANPTS